MPPCLDIYVVSKRRDKKTLERFVSLYVDRAKSEDRGEEELWLLQPGLDPARGDSYKSGEPAVSLTNALSRAVESPMMGFTLYLKSRDPSIYRAMMGFTTDNQVIFGLSLDYADEDDATIERAKQLLHQMAAEFEGHFGFLAWEEGPPIATSGVPEEGTAHYTWRRDTA